MKKLLYCTICLLTVPALALECVYSPEQEIVRSAENYREVQALGENFDANIVYPCGGTLTQLAVLRGNFDTLGYLYQQGADLQADVPLKGYEIPGAPEKIPFPLFAARYAPNGAMIDTMLNNGIDFHVKDSLGHDVFWYLEQNPVLRRSYLTKKGWDSLIPVTEIIERINDGDTY